MFFEQSERSGPHPLRVDERTTWYGCTEIRLEGEFDLAVTDRLRPVLERAISAPGDVLLNLERCDLIDVEVLGLLVDADARLSEHDAQLFFYNPVGQVRRVLELTGLCEQPLGQRAGAPSVRRAAVASVSGG